MERNAPIQHKGKKLDYTAEANFENEEQARDFYKIAKRRLLHPYDWYRIANLPGAKFVITDHEGRDLIRKMREGDLLRIDIPGPGNSTGDGFDWVRIEEISEHIEEPTVESCSVTVRPAANPREKDNTEIAHFFKNIATSTFLVKREKTRLKAEYHGRNELINLEVDKLSDKLRNALVGLLAKLGLSTPQWKSLIEGFVDTNRKQND